MKTTVLRQGDVLLVKVRKPSGERKALARENGAIVLAHGEVTGHTHAIKAPNASLFEAAGRVYLAIDGDVVALEHEEHDTIEIEPGFYEVIRQREYSPGAIRNVAD